MDKKLLKVEGKEIVLLLENSCSHNRKDYSLFGFIIKSQPNKIYMDYVSSCKSDDYRERDLVDISKIIATKLEEKKKQVLKVFLDNNINKINFYDEYFFRNFYRFTYNFEEEKHCVNNWDFGNIIDGIIKFQFNNKTIEFNVLTKELSTEDDWKYVFYSKIELLILLALEQVKHGKGNKTFVELLELGKWLRGKKSIKIYLKDIGKVEYKSNYNVSLRGILDFSSKRFTINDFYDFNPRLRQDKELEDLDYLQYGKKKYFINIET